jgi:hypothetical protein
MVFASIAISIALASPLVRRVFRPLIEPKPWWLFATRDPVTGSVTTIPRTRPAESCWRRS